ncbi:hypothetical protein Slin15195_G054060 [Septoria linicola]|uniref:Uncharacterized protein n=1 Tax=Septoria linicola TaxID=215465 RepID=A0A9Q9AMB2_9PEZI|nr:hypothetical protein Slin14017_G124860 [Septoria linicola]USW52087.1 hypothetical protein Slin15195_G054060 [Septoria linicola]
MKLGSSLYSRLERGSTWLSATWALEITSAAFSLACLLALFVVLSVANVEEIMVWHGITLNTITSILAMSSKLSALSVISSAISQTKWNLFYLGPRSTGLAEELWDVAVIGAVAFVVAVAFDPFAQQLVQYRGGEAYNSNNNVTLPVARRYDAGTSVTNRFAFIDRNSSLEGRIYQADFRIQAAVLEGLTQSSQALVQQLPVSCPSGNCTWEPRASLAVCSKCNDLATSIERSLEVAEIPLFLLLGAGGTGIMRTNSTRMTLPNGLWISGLDNYDVGTPKVRMVASGTGDRGKTNSM